LDTLGEVLRYGRFAEDAKYGHGSIMSEDAKRIERSNAYRQMMDLWAWKDFQLNVLDETRREALEAAIISEELKDIQVQRGIVKGVDSIMAQVDFIVDGAK
jgi:hypothetical protein